MSTKISRQQNDKLKEALIKSFLKFIEHKTHRALHYGKSNMSLAPRVLMCAGLHELDANSPLAQMTAPERMDADFRGTGLTIGRALSFKVAALPSHRFR
jgi:hypothetical protein